MTTSRARKLLLFFIALAVLAGAIIVMSSIIGITELVYPVKVDSVYVIASQLNFMKDKNVQDSINPDKFLFKPEQLQLSYEPIEIKTMDSLRLKGWYFKPTRDESGITILIIHDIGESKISYLQTAKAFTERGFRVCCMDMRASGESEGSYFTMGALSSSDVSIIVDSLFCRPETNYVALFGAGTGAAIAIRSAVREKRPVALVVQDCFATLTGYFERYARHKWGLVGRWFFPQMKKELEKQMGFNSDSLNLQVLIKQVLKPTLFVAKAKESIEDLKETHLLFELSEAEKKEFIFFRETGGSSFTKQRKEYYDKISAFISTSIPKRAKQTRFKKLVLNDHQIND